MRPRKSKLSKIQNRPQADIASAVNELGNQIAAIRVAVSRQLHRQNKATETANTELALCSRGGPQVPFRRIYQRLGRRSPSKSKAGS
jgi:hypothetical protein